MSTTMDPYDELAAMFLSDSGEPSAEEPETTMPAVRLLMVGHLPVRAALWLAPFTDAIARDAGPTALVRLDGDEPMVQVLRGPDGEPPATACRNLREMILSLGTFVRAWIVRPSAQMTAEAFGASGADAVTILSSADQAALVNSYRIVKDLVEAADARDRARPRIELAVLGADADAASRVAERLAETARRHLDVEVPLALTLSRMDAAIRTSCLRSFPGQTRPSLDDVLRWIGESAGRRGERPTPGPDAPGPGRAAEPVAADPTVSELVEDELRALAGEIESPPAPSVPVVEIERGAAWRATTAPRPASRSAPTPAPAPAPTSAPAPSSAPAPAIAGPGDRTRTVRLAPKVASAVEAKDDAGIVEPAEHGRPVPLARFAAPDGGLIAINVRCPDHERIELALDAEGLIHLLAPVEALRELHVATAWARRHRELIAMACPQHRVDPRGRTVMHVFTRSAVSVADLHGSALRLHLLTPVKVDGHKGWYGTPLNRPTG